MVLKPYKHLGTWVFDDPETGLVKEAFVAGVPEVLEGLLAVNGIPLAEAEKGFKLTFSGVAFPGYQRMVVWQRAEHDGNWYKDKETGQEGWLCPALLKYFSEAPAAIFIRADKLEVVDQQQDFDIVSEVVNFLQLVAGNKDDRGNLQQKAQALLSKIANL